MTAVMVLTSPFGQGFRRTEFSCLVLHPEREGWGEGWKEGWKEGRTQPTRYLAHSCGNLRGLTFQYCHSSNLNLSMGFCSVLFCFGDSTLACSTVPCVGDSRHIPGLPRRFQGSNTDCHDLKKKVHPPIFLFNYVYVYMDMQVSLEAREGQVLQGWSCSWL